MIRPLLKYHGGKFYLKDWIISHFPKDYEKMIYVEPFIGGGSVLLNKKPSTKEFAFDLDEDLINLFVVVQTNHKYLQGMLGMVNYSEKTFKDMIKLKTHPIRTYIINRMSRGGLGKSFAWSNRNRGGQPGDVNAWQTSILNLENIAKRIKCVDFNTWDFRTVLNYFNQPNVFLYLDPPYLPLTRTAKKCYKHEMTEQDHRDMLNIIADHKAKILLSGYWSSMYKAHLYGWNYDKKEIVNHSGQGKTKQNRVEVLWKNY